MKRLLSFLICLSLSLGLAACGGRAAEEGASSPTGNSSYPLVSSQFSQPSPDTPSSSESVPVDAPSAAPEAAATGDGQNILIAYFTWAENTVVEDREAAVQGALDHYKSVGDTARYGGVDAVSSASVVMPGNTAQIAGWIQERTGGDLFSIVVTDPYSSDYDECLDRAADEKANNARPQLVNHLENMEDYDIVFLGFPNWWYTVPMAIHSFLEEYGFSGKTVIPFVTHGTGGLAGTIRDMTAALPDSAAVSEALGIYRQDITSAQPAVNEWLDRLGFDEASSPEEQQLESPAEDIAEEKRFRLVAEGKEIYGTLYDTPAANDLWSSLPLELSFEDYNETEMIAYLSFPLTTQGEPEGCDPSPGDLCYYAPWGNISIFYQDFWYSNSLISLGRLDSDLQWFAGQSGDFQMVIEKVQ